MPIVEYSSTSSESLEDEDEYDPHEVCGHHIRVRRSSVLESILGDLLCACNPRSAFLSASDSIRNPNIDISAITPRIPNIQAAVPGGANQLAHFLAI